MIEEKQTNTEQESIQKDDSSKFNSKVILFIVLRIILCWLLMGFGAFIILRPTSSARIAQSAQMSIDGTIIAAYNNMYLQYEGTDKNASMTISLINRVNAHNANDEESQYYGKISILYYGLDESNDVFYNANKDDSERISYSIIKKTSKYSIEIADYNHNGCVAIVRIIENSTDNKRELPKYNYSEFVDNSSSLNPLYSNTNSSKSTKKTGDTNALIIGASFIIVFSIYLVESILLLIEQKYSRGLLLFEKIYTLFFGIAFIVVFLVLSLSTILSQVYIWSVLFAVIAILNIFLLLKYSSSAKKVKNNDYSGLNDVENIPAFLLFGIFFFSNLFLFLTESFALKPIIYIYPEENTNLQVTLGYKDNITTSYPKYEGEGWKVLASPNGELVDLKTGKNLYSLYWEGNIGDIDKSLDEGFVVKGEDVADFLDEKLEILGLNYKEREEFIVYWLPQLEKNKYNYIRFDLTEKCNEYMPLTINAINEDGSLSEANVDTIIRVLMVFKPLNHEIKVQEQVLPQQERNGFTVVEWGGSKI